MAMFSGTSQALVADNDYNFSAKHDVAKPQPGDDEMLIQVSFSGINPADLKHTTLLGVRNTTIGYDFCGKVVKSNVSKFKEGDVVAGFTPTGLDRPTKYGSHQAYLCCPGDMAFHVPEQLPAWEAAALPTVAMAAADSLFNLFGLPLPGEANANGAASDTTLLIWGASAAVGLCALQFAKAAGVKSIIAVASARNHDLLKELGATACFDYHDENVNSQIKEYINKQGGKVLALDAVGTEKPPSSAELMAACCSDDAKLASVVFQQDQKFAFPFAMRNREVKLFIRPISRAVTIPPHAEMHFHAWKAIEWAVQNYKKGFRFPKVDIIEGTAEEVLAKIEKVVNGSHGFGKIAVRHVM